MAATFVSASAKANFSGSSSLSCPAPSGIVTGNLLTAFVYAALNGSRTATAPTGWTQQYADQGPADQVAVWTKTATGTEPSTYTFVGNGYLSVAILQFAGASGLDITPTTQGGNGTAATTPGANAATAADMALLVFNSYNGESFTTPSGTTLRTSAAASGYSGVYVYSQPQGAAGPVPPHAATMSSSDTWRGTTVLLKSSAPVDVGTPSSITVAARATVTGLAGVPVAAGAVVTASVSGSSTISPAVSAAVQARAVVGPLQTAAVSAAATASAAIAGTSAPHPTPAPAPPVTAYSPYRASYEVTYTIDASYGGSPVAGATGMAPIGGTITDTTKPGVRRTLNLELAPEPGLYDKLAPEGTVLAVTAHVTANKVPVADVPMGVFDIDAQTLTEGIGKLTVTAPDKWQRLVRAKFPTPTASTPGRTVTSQIAGLVWAALGNGESVVVTATSTAVMGTQTWQDDRAQAIVDLAASIGAWCYFDRNGVFTIANVPLSGSNAEWLVDGSLSGVLIELDRSRNRTNTQNVVTISSTAASGESFAPQTVWDNNPASGTYAGPDPINHPELAAPFGVSVYPMTSQVPLFALQALEAAQAQLAKVVGLASQVSLSMVPNVLIDAFDSIDVMPPRERYDIPRVLERHMVDTVTHSLDVTQPMRIDGRSTRVDLA